MIYRSLILLIGIFLNIETCWATSYAALGGDWEVATNWDPNGIPQGGDIVTIPNGIIQSVTSNYTVPGTGGLLVEIYGTLLFPDPGNKITLPTGSDVILFGSGIVDGTSSGNSQTIVVDGIGVVWNAGAGDIQCLVDVTCPYSIVRGISLPITIISFDGKQNGLDNLIQWTTGVKQNFKYFILESSIDGINFRKISKIYSDKYEVFDRPTTIMTYYRLKLVDDDNYFEYSYIISVSNSNVVKYFLTNNGFDLILNCQCGYLKPNYYIYDIQGKLLTSKEITIDSYSITPLSNLVPGIYLIRIEDIEGNYTIKYYNF